MLARILCHNLCCLIQSAFELGIEATLWEKSEAEAEALSVEPDEAMEALAWV